MDRSEKIHQLLKDRTFIVASNRGPVEFRTDEDGIIRPHRGAGGLVSALEGALQTAQVTWVASAITAEDEIMVNNAGGDPLRIPPEDPTYNVRLIPIGDRTYHRYYNVISNLLLWFIQHYLWDIPIWPDIDEGTHHAWQEGYRVVNRSFAEEIVRAAGGDEAPVIMLQDYHLYLCARYIRDKLPEAVIQHFTHIPWCQPDYLRLMPRYMKDEIIEGLLSCDCVSFHTDKYARSFLWSCMELTGYDVDLADSTVQVGPRKVLVSHHPISIDWRQLQENASGEAVESEKPNVLRMAGGKRMLLRIDRIDFSKNIVRGFKVYRRFLDKYHEWWGKVVFVALLYPSRLGLVKYRKYIETLEHEVEELNDEFSTRSWQPVVLSVEDNYSQSLAALLEYDVLLVNSLFDGMNLVSKEGAALNTRNGVIILSENAGSFDELEEGVIPINPLDIEEGADAINTALLMDAGDRKRRASIMAEKVRSHTAEDWLLDQIEDILP
ncbi:MAG: trehalose-6-phosphate synthase [Actinobacteria bacterium]|nr:trehalose-6-phosphate synthase [Actinomycetota bacterium]